MRDIAKSIAAGLAALAFAAPAAAQFEADSDAPIEITADEMEWREEERIAIAIGNADALQGRYRLYADVLTAFLAAPAEDSGEAGEAANPNRIERIEADGNVRLVTPDEVVVGDNGVYDVENARASLEGEVVLTQGENVARGDRLDMNLDTGVSRLTAKPETGGRVTAVFSSQAEVAEEEAADEGAAAAESAE